MKIAKARRRTRQRGAAMVEGIVVVVTMLVFFGMITWAGRAYAAKIDQAAATRSDVLFYASNGCVDTAASAAAIVATDTPPATGDERPEEADGLAADLPIEGAGAVARQWNMASASRAVVVDGSAIVSDGEGLSLTSRALSTNVETTSFVTCNERTYDNDWTAVAQFTVDLFKSGGGVL